jgi:hypothetical protein
MLFRPLSLTPLTNFSPTTSKTRNPNKQNHFAPSVPGQFRPGPAPSFYSRPKVTSLTQLSCFQQLPKVTSGSRPVPPNPTLPVLPPPSFRNSLILNSFPAPSALLGLIQFPRHSYPSSGRQPKRKLLQPRRRWGCPPRSIFRVTTTFEKKLSPFVSIT